MKDFFSEKKDVLSVSLSFLFMHQLVLDLLKLADNKVDSGKSINYFRFCTIIGGLFIGVLHLLVEDVQVLKKRIRVQVNQMRLCLLL
jgi:hypothetical protein